MEEEEEEKAGSGVKKMGDDKSTPSWRSLSARITADGIEMNIVNELTASQNTLSRNCLDVDMGVRVECAIE